MKFYMTKAGVTMVVCGACGRRVRVRDDERVATHEPPPDRRESLRVTGKVFCPWSRKPV